MKFRKVLAALLLVALLVSSVAAMAAEKKQTPAEFVKFKGNAYCFKEAGKKKTDTVIRKGSIAQTADGKIHSQWTKVILSDANGKVYGKYYVKSSLIKPANSATEPRIIYSQGGHPKSLPGEISKCKKENRVILWNKVNVRAKPALVGKHVKTLHKGDKIKFVGKKSTDSRGVVWHLISYKGEVLGWLSEGV